MAPQRYQQLLDLVNEVKPKTIIEIGVWNGARAIEMAKIAHKYNDHVHYTGYDLFEQATAETDQTELNAKKHNTLGQVTERLSAYGRELLNTPEKRWTYDLVRGNTRATLVPGQVADFVYIDGGHSVETIRHDYECTKESSFIVFDDYYLPNDAGDKPDTENFGANRIVHSIDDRFVRILSSNDPLRMGGGGIVALAVVSKKMGW